jgi:hypothetical protein
MTQYTAPTTAALPGLPWGTSVVALGAAALLCAVGWLFLLHDGHGQLIAHGVFMSLCTTPAGFSGAVIGDWLQQLAPVWLHWSAMYLAMTLPVAVASMALRWAWPRTLAQAVHYLLAFMGLCLASALAAALLQMLVSTFSNHLALAGAATVLSTGSDQRIEQSGIWLLLAGLAGAMRLIVAQRSAAKVPAHSCACGASASGDSQQAPQWQHGSKDALKCCLDCFMWMALLFAFGLMQTQWMLLLTAAGVAACVLRHRAPAIAKLL